MAEALAQDWRKGDEWFDYAHRPTEFTRDILGVHLWDKQSEVIESLAQHKRVAVRSGHKVGKTNLASCAGLWWLYTKERARVILLMPSGRQVRTILWREIKSIHRNTTAHLEGKLFEMPDRGLQLEDGRELVGFSTDTPENIAGFSGDNILFIIDEGSGFEEKLFEVILGNIAGGGSILMLGNPTRTSGTFFSAFHEKARRWVLHHISSEDTPNVTEGKIVIPGLATREWIAEMAEEWGEDSPLYDVRVRGDFPSLAANAVIGMDMVQAAIDRWDDMMPGNEELRVGVDPARFGDDESVIFAVRGNFAIGPYCFRNMDALQLAEKVEETVGDLLLPQETPIIRVDEIGVGAGVLDALRRNPYFSVKGINVANSSFLDQFERKRDQMWFSLRDWIRQGGAIPADPKLQAELIAPTYDYQNGKLFVSSKDEMKIRLKRSPDRADALALAVFRDFADPPRLNGSIRLGRRRI